MSLKNNSRLIGKLTADPNHRQSISGKDITEIRLAVEEYVGKDTPTTTFIDVKLFDKAAVSVAKYCCKGRMIAIEGRLSQEMWQDKKTGKQRTQLRVIGEHVLFLDSKPRQSRAPQQQEEEEPQQQQTYTPDEADEDIPF